MYGYGNWLAISISGIIVYMYCLTRQAAVMTSDFTTAAVLGEVSHPLLSESSWLLAVFIRTRRPCVTGSVKERQS